MRQWHGLVNMFFKGCESCSHFYLLLSTLLIFWVSVSGLISCLLSCLLKEKFSVSEAFHTVQVWPSSTTSQMSKIREHEYKIWLLMRVFSVLETFLNLGHWKTWVNHNRASKKAWRNIQIFFQPCRQNNSHQRKSSFVGVSSSGGTEMYRKYKWHRSLRN